ncbi:unnamed protein product [Ceratitis capitata]|uniref:(Mediterranean fruit fly) hypothetical protein n=1 Tax=Ceratitis capitata TaxID=7213 RepID=A0A811V9C1_CERCA|nr:unnamed protein product [Ceratitis capitata]
MQVLPVLLSFKRLITLNNIITIHNHFPNNLLQEIMSTVYFGLLYLNSLYCSPVSTKSHLKVWDFFVFLMALIL